jgi:uncharacterized protein
MPLRLVVVQPTSLCNLNCRYCYVPNRRDSLVMSDETLDAVIRKVLASELVEESIEFLWHAGEPLTAGIPFFQHAIELMKRYNSRGLTVVNSIQTNGTLINQAWCDFFRDQGVEVGLSVDGPAFLHDSARVTWAGRGSHAKAIRGHALLKKNGVDVGVLCVLTRQSLCYPEAIIEFLIDCGFRWIGFNVEETENIHTRSSLRDVSREVVREE